MAYNLNRYIGNFLDPFFDDSIFEDINTENFGSMAMKTDIRELDDKYVMDIDLPGFDKNNLNVSLKDGYLTITGKVSRSIRPEQGKKHNFIHRERFSGSVTRSYYVGDMRQEDISASYKDGVLTIELPKPQEKKPEEASPIAIK
ncbi:MAG: Hsp20/alpha crystallin family protein [Firmicutes bacterium]|uniref:Hsp20/alpha crystallin family protein n=1 Tax=Candidatus Alloenteromonas pullistercoris TaxID=2840785 RepID=A0A9D9GV92_9FIRM|nr:Hsp20/alpha crystallin family protein [Candidatus Enteromonas pullistercoris]